MSLLGIDIGSGSIKAVAFAADGRILAQAAKPYPIGVLLPSTGSGANYSERPIKGLPLIAAEINKEDGLLGKHPSSSISAIPRRSASKA